MELVTNPEPGSKGYLIPALAIALTMSPGQVSRLVRAGAFGDPATLPRTEGGKSYVIPTERVDAYLRGASAA